jgi:ketosteroid isomerase-like protein
MEPPAEVLIKQEVLAVEAAWTQAHLDGDLQTIARIMGEDYVQITPDGRRMAREAALASYQFDGRAWEFAVSDQHEVRFYGESALLIGRWRARGVNNGVRFDYTARFACLYVRRPAGWQIVLDVSIPSAAGTLP